MRKLHQTIMVAVLALAVSAGIEKAHAESDNHLIYNTAGQLDIILKPTQACPHAIGWQAAEVRNRVTGANKPACYQESITTYLVMLGDGEAYSIFPKYRFTILRNISY